MAHGKKAKSRARLQMFAIYRFSHNRRSFVWLAGWPEVCKLTEIKPRASGLDGYCVNVVNWIPDYQAHKLFSCFLSRRSWKPSRIRTSIDVLVIFGYRRFRNAAPTSDAVSTISKNTRIHGSLRSGAAYSAFLPRFSSKNVTEIVEMICFDEVIYDDSCGSQNSL